MRCQIGAEIPVLVARALETRMGGRGVQQVGVKAFDHLLLLAANEFALEKVNADVMMRSILGGIYETSPS
jgi:DNA-directed RNA polymerase subunit K/omega